MRWWEYYFIRYAMGTFVGALLAFILVSVLDLTVSGFLASPFFQGSAYLAAGLTYCYVASGPILVFHAARLAFGKVSLKELVGWFAFATVFVSIVLSCILSYGDTPPTLGWGIALSSVVLTAQIAAAMLALKNAPLIYLEYQQLARNRQRNSPNEWSRTTSDEIVESYRHLREHGNSFFILLLQGLLAYALFEILLRGTTSNAPDTYALVAVLDRTPNAFLFLAMWIFPSVFVWLIATRLEMLFIKHRDSHF